jgi:hypothetical protein
MPDQHRSVGPLRAKLIMLFAAGFLAVQVAVPVVRLAAPRPSRFGWHMYSGSSSAPTFWVVTRDGASREVALEDHLGYARPELEYLPWLPRHLCRTVPDAAAVRHQADGAKSVEEFACP